MTAAALNTIRDLIQEDVGQRGLRADPSSNLISAFPDDFAAACQSLASNGNAAVAVVTGFFIPHALPPCGETDGPLGALFLARALTPLGIKVVLATDSFCAQALEVGLAAAGLRKTVPLVVLPSVEQAGSMSLMDYWQSFIERTGPLTHLIALERVGPSHTPESLQEQPGASIADIQQFLAEVPPEHHDRCHTMRGRDITASMSPAHRLFEVAGRKEHGLITIGIGDGGNEIGMGKIPWAVIRRNIPNGGLVACRITTDYLIVCGVSNWGAYGLAAGARHLRGAPKDAELCDLDREKALLELMVEKGPLVDGVSGRPTVSVDGLPFERYVEILDRVNGE
jgi:D-glutamate cyclase